MYLLVPLFPIIVKKILGRALYFVRFDFLLFMKMICLQRSIDPFIVYTLCIFIHVSIIFQYENRDMAIAMSSSRADPVLGLIIPSSCPSWGYLNI